MREAIRLTVYLSSCGLIGSCAMPAQDGGGSVDRLLEDLVTLERSALDRWMNSRRVLSASLADEALPI